MVSKLHRSQAGNLDARIWSGLKLLSAWFRKYTNAAKDLKSVKGENAPLRSNSLDTIFRNNHHRNVRQIKQLCPAIWASISTLVPCSALDAKGRSISTWRKGICQAGRLRPSCSWTAAGIRLGVPFTVVSCLGLGSLRAIQVARC